MTPTLRSTARRGPTTLLRFAIAGLSLCVLSACTDSTGPDVTSDTQGQIFFFRTRAGNVNEFGAVVGDIYRMNEDGSNVRRLTQTSATYRFLRLSPDGTRLTFYSDVGACYDIFVMDVDGTGLTQLTGVAANERCNERPHWSPDGSKIAFISSRTPELGWEAYVMNANGTGLVNVSNNPSTVYDTSDDAADGWSPDGRVVLTSSRDGTQRTYLVQADGTGLQALFGTGDYVDPQWSPDGTRVLACTGRTGSAECYVMSADGANVVNVTNDPALDGLSRWAPTAWSPSGTKVAFHSRRTGNYDVFVVGADGTGLVNVTSAAGDDVFLGWSPDGTRVLFASDRSGTEDLYSVAADGSGLVKLTTLSAPDGLPQAIWVRPE